MGRFDRNRVSATGDDVGGRGVSFPTEELQELAVATICNFDDRFSGMGYRSDANVLILGQV